MKIFLDTNVLISAVATRGLCADVFREVILSHQLVISRSLLSEIKRVLTYKLGVPDEFVTEFMRSFHPGNFGIDLHALIKVKG